ncbi:unnamed protein product [Arctia plantaginis]|uniref:Uncharacterized protein n=1 Tax=Arctia plantaginis TaxID=874455 RepID=A0A8S0ZY93_ARCPL|nr:unnamed protein product [Arctia plantaginis]
MPNKKTCPPCPGTSKIDLSDLGVTPSDLAETSDVLTGQSPIAAIPSTSSGCDFSKQREHELLALLKNYWSQIEDPLDQKIIDVLEDLCDVVHDTRRSLLSKYRNLIQITGDDLSIIMDGILVDMTDSYRTLHASVKMAVISYSAAIARNARAALSDIATTATDLVTVAANSMAQYDAFKQSLDHISRSWNNTASSMTNYMSEVDKKLLVLNHLTSSLKSTRGPPSTDSGYSPDPIVGASLILVSGSPYRSTMGTLNFSDDQSIGFVGSKGAMAPLICPGCKQKVQYRENLLCILCKNTYDLECANVSKDRFNKTMTMEQKKTWKCQTCRCKMPKIDNTSTPIRLQDHETLHQTSTCIETTENNNVTIRKRSTKTNNDSVSSDDLNMLGDTLNTENRETASPTNLQTEVILKNLNELIIERLRENNILLITELQNTIQTEIKKAITQLKDEVEQKTNALSNQYEQTKHDIKQISLEISKLKLENEKLQTELKDLTTTCLYPKTPYTEETNAKKLVLYGFPEYYDESEYNLHARIIDFFEKTMQINILGYIEDLHRIGKNTNNHRPLVIELLSKRIAKFITANRQCLQGTRIYISEFLDDIALKKRLGIFRY